MNSKYLLGGIGSIIFFFQVIIFVLLYQFIYFGDFNYIEKITLYIFFIFISLSVILIGIGFLEFYFMNRIKISLLTFIFSLAASSFLFISLLLVIPSYNTLESILTRHYIWFISYNLLDIFFILLSVNFITQKKINRYPFLTLISGILTLAFCTIHLIISNINHIQVFDYLSFRFLNINVLLIKSSISFDINDIKLVAYLYIRLNDPTYHSIILFWDFPFLFLGLAGILIGIIFFMEFNRNVLNNNDLASF